MPKKARVTRQAQRGAAINEVHILRQKQENFLGSAKVSLADLDFAHSSARELNEANIERLLASFELSGCQRIDAQYHIPAVIDPRLLTSTLDEREVSIELLRSADATQWPLLKVPSLVRIECLHGQHRVAAARKYLRQSDQWWVVDFYSSASPLDLRLYLTEQTSNERPLSAGEIYFHILRCDEDDNDEINRWLALIQSDNCRREVQQLNGRKNFNESFRSLAAIPALGPSMQAGNIRAFMSIKCDEEIICYLSQIRRTWVDLVDGNISALAKIDRSTIELLQSRCPANCRQDREMLEPLFENGTVFHAFDPASRSEIWHRLLTLPRLIPSLETFFHDLKHLRDVALCITKLIPPSHRQTIRQACRKAFSSSNDHRDDHRPHEFERSYCNLWLLGMQFVEDIRPGSLLLESSARIERRRKNFHREHSFVKQVSRLGFWSEKIIEKLEESPDRLEAREALIRARPPDTYRYPPEQFELLVENMVELFDRAETRNDQAGIPQLVVDGIGEKDLDRRRGRPYQGAFQESAQFLSLANICMHDSRSLGGLTAFYIRRNMYHLFFKSVIDSLTQITSASPTEDPVPDAPASVTAETTEAPVPEAPNRHDIQPRSRSPLSSSVDDEHELDLNDEADLADTYSPSHYSRHLSQYTDMSVTQDTIDNVVNFCWWEDKHVMKTVVVQDVTCAAEEVLKIATDFRHEGLLLLDRHDRSMQPSECFMAAVENDNTIIVKPLDRKRKADNDLQTGSPARKPRHR